MRINKWTGGTIPWPEHITISDEDEVWVDAIAQIDDDNIRDKRPLCDLLDSDCELSREARYYLADLIYRRCVPLPRGQRPTPAYATSLLDQFWWLACNEVRDLIQHGELKDAALDKVAKQIGRTTEQLRTVYEHGPLNRDKNRRYEARHPHRKPKKKHPAKKPRFSVV
jgi:hypothetical protein